MFGVLEKANLQTIQDLSLREVALLLPLGLLTIYYGVHPAPILDACAASVDQIVKSAHLAMTATHSVAVALR